jgi:GGDEF domain-containing protein
VTDRTESQRSRDRIEASERQLRAVTDNLPMLITYVDADERLRFMNGTFHDWLGVDLKQAVGRPLAEVVGAEHYASRREHLRAALAGERVEFEVVSMTLAGPAQPADGLHPRHARRRHGARHLHAQHRRDRDEERGAGAAAARAHRHAHRPGQPAPVRRAAGAGAGAPPAREAAAGADLPGHRPLQAINDSHGHGAGDAVLKEFAARLLQSLRATDVAARLSGDEFVVILDGLATRDEAVAVANKLLQAIREPMAVGDRRWT